MAIGLDNINDGTVRSEGVVDFTEVEAKLKEVENIPLHQVVKNQIKDIRPGLTALFQGDYERAMTEFKAAAARGNGMAQNSVGILYEKGFGTQQNFQEAANWYHTAITHGNLDAVYNLAVLKYEGPPGIKQNVAEALELFDQGCKMGDQGACEYGGTIRQEAGLQ